MVVLLSWTPLLLALQPWAVRLGREPSPVRRYVARHPVCRATEPTGPSAGSPGDFDALRDDRRMRRVRGEEEEEESGFDDLFASLLEEEERAVAAAHAEELLQFEGEFDEVGSKSRRPAGPRAQPRSTGSGGRVRTRDRSPAGNRRGGVASKPLYSAQPARGAAPGGAHVSTSDAPTAGTVEAVRGVGGAAQPYPTGTTLVTVIPTKVMIFVDGTWLYYQLYGRGRRCPIVQKFGERWWEQHYVDFGRLPQIISDHISAELSRTQPHSPRVVEVVRTLVFSSFREEAGGFSDLREGMFQQMQQLNFEVHLGQYYGGQEKCVDIALAVDMLHYATVPSAFDVAVLVSGDRDFIPALVRTRQKGKRVAICSMANSAASEFEDPHANIKDFPVCWLDEHMDDLIVPVHPSLLSERPEMARYLRSIAADLLAESRGTATLSELEEHLASIALGDSSAAVYVAHEFGGLMPFLELYEEQFDVATDPSGELLVSLTDSAALEAPAGAAGAGGRGAPSPSSHTDPEPEAEAPPPPERSPPGADQGGIDDAFFAAEQFLPPPPPPPPPPRRGPKPAASGKGESETAGGSGRSDGALIVDGSLMEVLEQELMKSEAEQRAAASAEGTPEGTDDAPGQRLASLDAPPTPDDFAKLTVPQLKAELREQGLPASGHKVELIRRLVDAVGHTDDENESFGAQDGDAAASDFL
jgi:hypothetical protein